MKRIIFSIYNEIPDNHLENNNPYAGDSMPKSMRTKLEYKKHFETLKKVKDSYAEDCEADFKLFLANDDPKNDLFNLFKERFGFHFGMNRKDFDIMNFFKLFLFEEMARYYDEVVYLDFDVVPNTHYSIFRHLDFTRVNALAINANKKNIWSIGDLKTHDRNKSNFDDIVSKFDKQSMYCKMMAKRAMLMTQNITGTEDIINTGILAANKKAIQDLKLFDDFTFKVDTLIQAKEEQMFGKALSNKFFLNNEIFFTFHLEHKNIPYNKLTPEWHFMLLSGHLAPNKEDISKAHLLHVIDKNFERVFKLCGIQPN